MIDDKTHLAPKSIAPQLMDDTEYKKNVQRMVDKLLASDYEILGQVDAHTGHLMVFGANTQTRSPSGFSYDEELPHVLRALLPDEYFEEGMRTLSRSHIMKQLEISEFYTCTFPTRSKDSAAEGRKQWKFGYLDVEHTQILMSRSDVTYTYAAERDALTGLYNKQAFYRYARAILDANPNEKFLLMRCDLDRFKAYNDLYGTQAGDKLLAEYGQAIRRRTWAKNALFAHLDADHFCALYPADELDLEELKQIYENWLGRMTPGYRLTSSIGIYEITEPEIHISLMCDRALLALQTVKHSYSEKLAWYDDNLRVRLMQEQTLIDEMESALQQGQFQLYFQPQINYANKTLVGAEVLVRWQHPKRGLIPPGDFIPLFERNGFILKLDTYVWEKSCLYLRQWLDLHPGENATPLSVNISRYDIYSPTLCETLHNLIQKYALPIHLLRLEITETAYMEKPEQLIVVVKELRRLGFLVEMDDFGAGYSSLNVLKDVPVDVLKLDIRFLSGGEESARGGQILYSVIRMASWLCLPVIAEGVETMAQADYLKSLNCLYMQGYYFARPMPAQNFEEFRLQYAAGEIGQYTEDVDHTAGALWDPATQDSMIFNRFVGGAAIIEYWEGNVEIIRANDLFYTAIETSREQYLAKQRHTLERFSKENQLKYIYMLEHALETGAPAECEVESLPQNEFGDTFWTHNRVCVLTGSGSRALFCLSVENITARKRLEERLCAIQAQQAEAQQKSCSASNIFSNQELQIIEKHSGILICRYYMNTHVLERLYESATSRYDVSLIQENIPAFSVENKIVSPDTAQIYIDFFNQMCAGVPHGNADIQIMVQERGYRWHHGEYSLVYDERGVPAYALVTLYDNTEERDRRQALLNWHDYLARAQVGASLCAELNLSQNIVERIVLLREGAVQRGPVKTFADVVRCGQLGVMAEDVEREYHAFFDRWRLLGLFGQDVKEDHFDYSYCDSSGCSVWMRASVGMTVLPNSIDVTAAISFTTLDPQEKELERLSQKLYRDALTGVLNREGFERRAQELLTEYSPQRCTALLMIDLDNFKQVNDRLGHLTGDMLLQRVADSLVDTFHQFDAVGRIGGDEFMVLLSGDFSSTVLERKALELLSSMKMDVGSHDPLPISVSIGIAYGWARTSFENLYRIADVALYAAKKAGKSRYHIINTDTNDGHACAQTSVLSLQSLLDQTDSQGIVQSRTPYEALIENMPGGILVITLSDKLHFSMGNEWLANFLGYTLSHVTEFDKEDIFALLHPEDAPAVAAVFRDMWNGTNNVDITYRLRASNGTYVHIRLCASMTERRKDEVIFYGIQTDVDNMMKLQTALEDSKHRLQTLIDAIPGSISLIELSENFKVTHYGNWIFKYIGYTREEVDNMRHGQALGTVWPEDAEDVQNVFEQIRKGKDKVDVSFRLQCKSGQPKYIHAWGSVYKRTPEKIIVYAMYTASADDL